MLELEIVNTGSRPTYGKGGKSSTVNLSFVDPTLMGDRLDWNVSEQYTVSDNFAIVYKLYCFLHAAVVSGTTEE